MDHQLEAKLKICRKKRVLYALKILLLILAFAAVVTYISVLGLQVKKGLFALYALGFLHLGVATILMVYKWFYNTLMERVRVVGFVPGCLSAIIAAAGRLLLLVVVGMLVLGVITSVLDILFNFRDWLATSEKNVIDLICVVGIGLSLIAFIYYVVRFILSHKTCQNIKQQIKDTSAESAWFDSFMEEDKLFEKALSSRNPMKTMERQRKKLSKIRGKAIKTTSSLDSDSTSRLQ